MGSAPHHVLFERNLRLWKGAGCDAAGRHGIARSASERHLVISEAAAEQFVQARRSADVSAEFGLRHDGPCV